MTQQVTGRKSLPFIGGLIAALVVLTLLPAAWAQTTKMDDIAAVAPTTSPSPVASQGQATPQTTASSLRVAKAREKAQATFPLCVATQYRDVATVKRLIEAGADVNAADWDGWTPLMLAAAKGRTDVAAVLLEGGADPRAEGPDGITPLMAAALTGNGELAKLLLDKSAAIEARNHAGLTALDLAQARGHAGVADMLRKRPATVKGQVVDLEGLKRAYSGRQERLGREIGDLTISSSRYEDGKHYADLNVFTRDKYKATNCTDVLHWTRHNCCSVKVRDREILYEIIGDYDATNKQSNQKEPTKLSMPEPEDNWIRAQLTPGYRWTGLKAPEKVNGRDCLVVTDEEGKKYWVDKEYIAPVKIDLGEKERLRYRYYKDFRLGPAGVFVAYETVDLEKEGDIEKERGEVGALSKRLTKIKRIDYNTGLSNNFFAVENLKLP